MRLIDLQRTTSFRLAVLFLGIFGAISVFLFAYLYISITGFESDRVDDWLNREYAAMQRKTPEQMAAQLTVLRHSDPANHLTNGMYEDDGTYVAGALLTAPGKTPEFGKPFSMRLEGEPGRPWVRCIAIQFPSQQYAMRCQDAGTLHQFNKALLRVLIVAAGVTFSVGLLGAALFGLRSVRRLDAVTASIRQIIAGDLSQRLPTHRGQDDLERLVRVVNEMLHEIERLMNEVKGVCDAIAHDLRTPLTRLIARLERGQRRARTTDDYRLVLDDAFVEANGMLRTFNALLRISEIESGTRRESFRPVNLASIVQDVFEYYEPSSEEKAIRYCCQVQEHADFVLEGDPNLLFEALANLVENAIKFAPEHGDVTLRLTCDDTALHFSVTDNGPGIPPSEHEAVLQRFYRGEASRHTPGNGLGLSLASAVAAMHGMNLAFEPVNVGCRAVLSRPVTAVV